jgi:hypothetical protein
MGNYTQEYTAEDIGEATISIGAEALIFLSTLLGIIILIVLIRWGRRKTGM